MSASGREIDALVCVYTDAIDIELDELEENLCRKALTVVERARDERRQKTYLLRNPETRRGFAGAVAKHERVQARQVSFSEQRATERPGPASAWSSSACRSRLYSATAIAKLSAHPMADNHRQLLALARLPDSIRKDVVHRIATGRADRVKTAVAQIVRPEPVQRVERSP